MLVNEKTKTSLDSFTIAVTIIARKRETTPWPLIDYVLFFFRHERKIALFLPIYTRIHN